MSFESDRERLKFVDRRLSAFYWSIKPTFELTFPGSTLVVSQGFRTPTMQEEAHISRASPADGRTTFSKHQLLPAQAIDVMVEVGDKLITDGADSRYTWLGREATSEGLVWGAVFKTARDFDHFETAGPQPNQAQVFAALKLYNASNPKMA